MAVDVNHLAVYVTRGYGALGTQVVYRLPRIVTDVAIRLIAANVIAWGLIGLATAAKVVLS